MDERLFVFLFNAKESEGTGLKGHRTKRAQPLHGTGSSHTGVRGRRPEMAMSPRARVHRVFVSHGRRVKNGSNWLDYQQMPGGA